MACTSGWRPRRGFLEFTLHHRCLHKIQRQMMLVFLQQWDSSQSFPPAFSSILENGRASEKPCHLSKWTSRPSQISALYLNTKHGFGTNGRQETAVESRMRESDGA